MQWLYRGFDRLRDRARTATWNPDLASGRRGEDLAHRYLQKRGFTVVARNFQTRSKSAEIDIIAWQSASLVFVEVKTRAVAEFGPPDRAVTLEKQQHILQAASEYLRRADLDWSVARFDIVSIILGPPVTIHHIEDAFSRRRSY